MPLKWKYFLSKRRMTPSQFLETNKISSYDSLAECLQKLDIELPQFDEVAHHFTKKIMPPLHSNEKIKTKSSNSKTVNVSGARVDLDDKPLLPEVDQPNTQQEFLLQAPSERSIVETVEESSEASVVSASETATHVTQQNASKPSKKNKSAKKQKIVSFSQEENLAKDEAH